MAKTSKKNAKAEADVADVADAAVQSKVASLLMDAQRSKAQHARAAKALAALHASQPAAIEAALWTALRRVLVVFRKERAVDRVIEFVGHFGASQCTGAGNLNARLIRFMLVGSRAKERAVRFRSCQMLACLMNCMSEDADIDDDVWEEIVVALVDRTHDRVVCVKQQAVAALCRLQDPTDSEDPVVARYRALLGTDPAKDVRRAVLANVGIAKATLPDIVARSADVAADVRRQSFEVLAQKVPSRALSVEQRVVLIERGARDRDAAVRRAFTKLVCDNWLVHADGSVVGLLRTLDVERNEAAAELLLNVVIGARAVKPVVEPIDLAALIPQDGPAADEQQQQDVSAPATGSADDLLAASLYWRVLCDEAKKESVREDLLPDGATLCRDLRQFQAWPFVQRQLLRIARHMDFADEGGRRLLSALLRPMLASVQTCESLIADIATVLARVHPGDEEYCGVLLEVIADVHEAVIQLHSDEAQSELAALAERARQADDDDVRAGHLLPASQAARAAHDLLRALHESTWTRYMLLAVNLLQNTGKSPADPEIAGLEQMVLRGAAHRNRSVREAAVGALGSFCLLAMSACVAHAPLLLSVLEHDVPTIQRTAARALFDIVLVYGDALESAVANPILSSLHRAMLQTVAAEGAVDGGDGDASDVSIVSTLKSSFSLPDLCAEGFAKLLFVGRSLVFDNQDGAVVDRSDRVLMDLVVLLFNGAGSSATSPTAVPVAGQRAASEQLRQCLSAFFPAYASASASHQQALVRAAGGAMGELMSAAAASDAADVEHFEEHALNAVNGLGFLLHLTDARHNAAAKRLQQTVGVVDHRDAVPSLLADARALVPVLPRAGRELCKMLAQSVWLDRRTMEPTAHKMISLAAQRLADQCLGMDRLVDGHLRQFSSLVDECSAATADDGKSAVATDDDAPDVQAQIEQLFVSRVAQAQLWIPADVSSAAATRSAAKQASRSAPKRATARAASARLRKVINVIDDEHDTHANVDDESEESDEEEDEGEEEEEEKEEEANEEANEDEATVDKGKEADVVTVEVKLEETSIAEQPAAVEEQVDESADSEAESLSSPSASPSPPVKAAKSPAPRRRNTRTSAAAKKTPPKPRATRTRRGAAAAKQAAVAVDISNNENQSSNRRRPAAKAMSPKAAPAPAKKKKVNSPARRTTRSGRPTRASASTVGGASKSNSKMTAVEQEIFALLEE